MRSKKKACCSGLRLAGNSAGRRKDCVKKGSDYALVAAGGKVYTLEADGAAKAELDKLAGKMADVTGDVNGTTVMVRSVKMAKTKK